MLEELDVVPDHLVLDSPANDFVDSELLSSVELLEVPQISSWSKFLEVLPCKPDALFVSSEFYPILNDVLEPVLFGHDALNDQAPPTDPIEVGRF